MSFKGIERSLRLVAGDQDFGGGTHAAFEVEDLYVSFEEPTRGQVALRSIEIEE